MKNWVQKVQTIGCDSGTGKTSQPYNLQLSQDSAELLHCNNRQSSLQKKSGCNELPYTLAKTKIIYPKNVRAKLAMDFT